jgi:serine-type D-Ala-D-Ala carboxypeptidase
MISGKIQCAATEVGYDPSRLEAVNRHLKRLIDIRELQAASYCLSRDGKVFADNAIGRLTYKEDDARELRPDSIQWIASITKIITAAAVFKLVEDGFIRPNQSVGEILPEMSSPPFNTITIAMLLSHTSGLNPDDGCFENRHYKSPWDFIAMMPDANWLEAGLSVGMRSKPGTEWAYCSFGFVILGEIITRVSGLDVHDFIRREIFEPCGMADTAFPWRLMAKEEDRDKGRALFARMAVRTEERERDIAAVSSGGTGKKLDSPFVKVPGTGGGISSTASDLCKFGNMLMNGGTTFEGKRILGRKTVERMTELYTGPEIKDFCWGAGGVHRMYALGPDKRRTADSLYSPGYYYHEGAGGCALIIDPQERMVASWFVPFVDDVWRPAAIYGTGAVIWSGLL